MSGDGSRIPCSKTYFATGLFSELTLKGTLKDFPDLKPRLITNPTAADDSAIPTAPNNNLFSPRNDIILLAWIPLLVNPLPSGDLARRLHSKDLPSFLPGAIRNVSRDWLRK